MRMFVKTLASSGSTLLVYGLILWAIHAPPMPMVTGIGSISIAALLDVALLLRSNLSFRIRFERVQP